MRGTLDHQEAKTRTAHGAAADTVKTLASVGHVERSSLAVFRFSPLAALLKLLVQADASRSKLKRLRAVVTLLAVLCAFALLGYVLPTLL